MKLYLLYVSYPYEGGYVYGTFSSKEKAEEVLNDGKTLVSESNAYIKEIELDTTTFIEI